ncbi:MATE family efflux transporter [Paraneptunicella aestuarii]|uniref:MATE family efflux transporter n=1 Tax=Paraneptunicella aestuarii TaxID=2831148 RepID=UPI001E48F1EB|nr:MATE family efflux transporter [Paraneptunicella aestuarii]UAA40540.1 MATE family efflux transporter [Paraneptunicella aestuarii]
MIKLSEVKCLAKLAWPLLIAQITQTLMGVSDTIMAGRVSSTDMAAVAVASSIVFPIMVFLQGIILALPPIISRLNGAQDKDAIPKAGHQAFWLSIYLSLPVFLLSFVTNSLVAPMTMEPALKTITADYLSYVFAGIPAFVFYQVLRQYGEGLSITKPSMIIMVIGLIVNIPANYVFIYGKLGAPALGGAGCGVATTIVFCAMLTATWLYTKYAKALQDYPFFGHLHPPEWREIRKILKLGVPIAFTLLFEITLFAIVAIMLARYGSDVVAAHQIALNVSSIFFMIPLSIGMATTIRIGYALGQGDSALASTTVYSALISGLLLAGMNATLCYILRYPISELYSTEPEVIEMAAQLMFLAAIFQFSDGTQIIAGCALRGYKDTKAMFYLSFLSYWMIGLPTGYILAMTDWIVPAMAAKGFWIGFIVGLTAAALLLGMRLLWTQHKVKTTSQLVYP